MIQIYKTVFKYLEILKRKGARRKKEPKKKRNRNKKKTNNQGVNGIDMLIIH